MLFRMLGPLEVDGGGVSVGLGGTRQRATLGFLMMHANRVVASSQLIDALWPAGRAPQSARKILQNSVWRLRRALPLGDGEFTGVRLQSQAPGYMLCAEPDQIDLYHFRRLAQCGHAELAAGAPRAAAVLLREALALWRGPVLADLVETGIDWPELASVQNARLDALEDFFEAELACGHHHRVLAELEKTVATEVLRERLLGQLMLALYRSGRQTDALDVYAGARAAMAERLGLEPGHALQALQQAVLTHDPALIPVGIREQIEVRMTGASREPVRAAAARPAAPPPPAEIPAGPPEAERRVRPETRPERVADEAAARPVPRTMVAERKEVSVLIARVQLMPDAAGVDPQRMDEAVEQVAATIRGEVECLGGTVAASIGPISLVLFGVPEAADDDAERAVAAALTIRDQLTRIADPGEPDGGCTRGVSVQVAVATGEALVRYQPDRSGVPPTVNGALLDECHTLLSDTRAGEIRVCDNTRRSTGFAVTYQHGSPSSGWTVGGFRQEYTALHAVPVIDREYDLDVLRGLLQRSRHQATPHLVTVLGEPGVGKTRFVMEFERRVAANADAVRLVVGRVRPGGGAHPLEALHDLLLACCGILQGDRVETMTAKLTATVRRLKASEEDCRWMLSCLAPLVDPAAAQAPPDEMLTASREFLGAVAAGTPLVLVFEDLHWADQALVDFVENLTASQAGLPIFVIVTAGPELLKRRPEWGEGSLNRLTITLEPISDAAIDRLLEFLMSTTEGGAKNSVGGLLEALLESGGREPDARRHQLRRILASGSASLRYERCSGGGGLPAAAPECTPRLSGHAYG
ncbi:AAA family ATPase [Streptomyces cyaneofuscatus]|nr:AAA family ATPase [Streptomyces cyaneofuscatus]